MTPENSLALEMSLRYGMRIGDVLATKRDDVERGSWTYAEEKTGKKRRIRCCKSLQDRLIDIAGSKYVFQSRGSPDRHRSRQAVYKDIKKAVSALGINENVSPHSARKIYAVDKYARSGDIKAVQRLLNHDSESVTMLYALSDVLGKCKK